jgi:multidrug efflux pump subunit AcrA (membrane-fusion protein)
MVQLNVEEKNVHLLKPGLQGKATLTSNPDCKLPVRVSKVSSLPSSPGKFDAHLVLEGDTPHAALMPGMACTVKFVPYLKKDAIAVPNKALHEEDDKHLVYVLGKDGKHETRQVTIGRTDGDHTEILTGLHEGEEILLERPKPKAADKGKGVTR